MTTRKLYTAIQLRQYLYSCLVYELDHHKGNGSAWLFPEEFTEKEQNQLCEMLDQVVDVIGARADKLSEKITKMGLEVID